MKLKAAIGHYVSRLEKRDYSESHIDSVTGRLSKFAEKMGEIEITAVTKANIRDHFIKMKRDELAEGTLAGHKSTHRAFWRYCKKRGWVTKNPSKALIGNKQFQYSFEPVNRYAAPEDDFAIVILALPAFIAHRNYAARDVRDALIVALTADSSARRGAIWAITRRAAAHALKHGRQIDGAGNVYHIIIQGDGAKTGRSKIRFFQETADLLQMWLNLMPRNADYICCNLRTGQRLSRENVSLAFIRICEFANVPTFRSHAIRKRVITDVIETAGDPKAGQLYAGHKSPRTTQVYYNQLEDDKVDVIGSKLAQRRRKKDINLADIFFGIH